MPQGTCTSKICSWRAIHWLRSSKAAYRGSAVMSWVTQSVIGCVPEQSTPRLRFSAAPATCATVSARSAHASSTVWQMPVMTSTHDCSSSCLALGW